MELKPLEITDKGIGSNCSSKKNSPKKAPKSEQNFPWTYYIIDSPRCEKALDTFRNDGTLPSVLQRPQVAQYIKRMQVSAMLMGDYAAAEKYKADAENFIKVCKDSLNEDNATFYKHKLKHEILELHNQIQQINQRYDNDIYMLISEKKKLKEQIDQKYKENYDKFIKKWEDENILRDFNRQSVELLTLRSKEKSLIIEKDYYGAAQLKKDADLLEKQETKQAQARAQQAMMAEREALDKDYDKQQNQLNNIINRKIKRVERQREEVIHPINARINKLVMDRDKGYFPDPLDASFDTETMFQRTPMAISTPRTRQKLVQFRCTKNTQKLQLNGFKAIPMDPKVKLIVPKLAQSR